MSDFATEVVQLLDRTDEIEIETMRRDGRPRRTTIWIVVADGTPYVRSVRGADGAWYRAVVREPAARLHAGGRAIDVRLVPATDDDSVRGVSEAITRKYQSRWAGPTASMLRPEVLPTTLRVEPA